jgi:AbrB family looped-hinge helix DNA binding protein
MTTSILSPKHQIVIPKKIRQDLGLKPGQRLQITAREGHVEIRPILTPEQLIGFLKGPEPLEFKRDADREL